MQTPVLRYYTAARVTSDHIVNYASLRGDCLPFTIATLLNSSLSKGALVMDCPYMFIAVLYSAPGPRSFCTKTKLFIICREAKTRAHMHANILANDMLRSPQHVPRFALCMLGGYCDVILFMKFLRYETFPKRCIIFTSRYASLHSAVRGAANCVIKVR